MKFAEFVDIDELRGICESFTSITGAVTALLELDGTVLIATGWQDICTRFHRINNATACRCLESDTILASELKKGTRYNIYKCKNGLIDVAVPIMIRDMHVANFFTGQFFSEAPDMDYFIRQAEQFGFEQDAYLAALQRVPIFSNATTEAMMVFFTRLAQLIGETGFARKELEESRKQYFDLVEGTPDLITRVDAGGHILFANHAAIEIYGLAAEDCLGRAAFDFVHPDDLATTKQAFDLWLTGGKEILSHENRQVSVDGQVHYMAWSIRAEYDENGKVCGFASTARDITEYKRTEEQRAKLESRLHQAQKMEAVGQLAGGVAHDFNNMLGVIMGHAELALICSDSSRPIAANLEGILKAAKHSAELTRQLLTYARKQTIEPKVLSLNESVAGMLTMLQRLIGENIQLSFTSAANLWPVKIDPSQTDQILANLCVNARDAISGVGKITIKTENISIDGKFCSTHPYVAPGDYVQLSVSDDGIGMDSSVIAHIFEPFYTTKGIGVGTGLGLATVFGAVKQNNGFIDVYSEPGQGAIFKIYLPREKIAVAAAEEDLAIRPLPGGTETVLLVEDDEMLLDIETTMLEESGYTVLAALTVGQAQALAQQHAGQIHLLLTDVIMPEMNGRDLSITLQAICPELKVLFMSGYTADIIATQGVIGDNLHFLQKPFSIETLTAKVREVLDVK